MDNIVSFWDGIMKDVPDAIQALIILMVAFLCASIVKGLINQLLDFLKFDKAMEKGKVETERKKSLREFIGKLFYFIVFVFFIPAIFEKLGMNDVAQPVISMMDKLLIYLPNIIAATVLLIIGLYLAKLVKELLIPIFKNLNIDSYLTKIGFESNEKNTISEVLANVVYVLILIPIIIAALDALKIDAISKPATEVLNSILQFMPRIGIAIVILFVGKFIAGLAANLTERILVSIGTDKITESIVKTNSEKKNFSLSKVIAQILKYVIVIFFLVEGLNILKLEVLTHIGNKVIEYMPYAISAIITFGISLLASNFAENYLNSKFPDNKITSIIVKVIIITIGAFITLYQLGIAKALVNSAFIIILSAFAVAFSISFGIGGRDFASHMLGKLEKKIDKKK